MRLVAAAVLYFVAVFAVGILLGPIRVLLLEPRLGPVIAVLCEAPFLLTAIVLAARWVPRVTHLEPRAGAMVLVGLGALILQQTADLAVGYRLRGISAAEQLARFATREGLIYLALVTVFALMPLRANRIGH
jgi:hypothetical protein